MRLFVWDFHGVLEKDNERAVIEISNRILETFGFKERFTQEENLKLYGRKWFEYFEELLPDEPHEVHLKLQQACIKLEEDQPHIVDNNIKPNDYAHEVLKAIRANRHDQILISNMSDVALNRSMAAVDVTDYFPPQKAFACNTRDGSKVYTKHERLKTYLSGKQFERIIIIGDTPNDISLASIATGTTYLYVHPHLNFPNCKPTYKIRDLREVLGEV